MAVNPYPLPQKNRLLTNLAWLVIVLVSALPEILLAELTRWQVDLTYYKIGLVLGLSLAAIFWRALRPLRNFFLILLMFFGLSSLRTRIDFSLPGLQTFLGGNLFDARMQAEQTGKLVISLLIITTLLVLGYKRKGFFLAGGDLRAPIEPVPLLGFPKSDPWYRFALQWGIYIAAALALVQYLGMRPSAVQALQLLPVLPSILFYAALNAFNEEVTYRASILATLEPITGSRNSLWMTAYFFGIAHYFGTPGGILGGLLSVFMGWILGKAMLETRGLFWAWWMHFLSDVVIFIFIAMSLQ